MKPAQTSKSNPTAGSTNPSSSVSEPPTISIEARIGLTMFLLFGFLFGMLLLADLLSGFFR